MVQIFLNLKLDSFMKRKVLILSFCCCLNACISKHNDIKALEGVPNTDTLYLKSNLFDCLVNYIESFDTVKRSWNMTPIYLVSFYLEKKDTLVYITGRKISPVIPNLLDNPDYMYVGYFFFKDKPVLIDDTKDSIGNHLYIKSRLKKNVESVGKGRDKEDFERHTLPIWIYKVTNKTNLLLVRKEKGVILK
jgi:hypothetical protein